MLAESLSIAALLATAGVLLAISVFFGNYSERAGLPLALVFLGVGVLAGREGLGGIAFDNYDTAFRLGTIALTLILFDGGLNTPLNVVRRYGAPAGALATVGVVGTAALVALVVRALGFPLPFALLLGAVVSSTDAAAVFSVLRGSRVHLSRRVGVTLEAESGLNDPMAVILTTALTINLLQPTADLGRTLFVGVLAQLVVGTIAGVAIGHGGKLALSRLRSSASGLYPIITTAFALGSYGITALLGGSGFLAVYLSALIIGNGQIPFRAGVLRVHDALAWLSQITMFLILGLLVYPSRLLEIAIPGVLIALFLAVVARPLMVAACLLPFRFKLPEIAYVGWVGLRGAVPIILATIPVLAGAPGAQRLFDIVFLIVLVNAIIPGMTVSAVTRWLDMAEAEPPSPPAVLHIESMQPLGGDLMSFYVDDALAVAGASLAELPFPEGASVALIVRGDGLVPPKGSTALMPGDHVYVFARPEDGAMIRLMFGRPED
jgi:potassium/hydrogen antiporter